MSIDLEELKKLLEEEGETTPSTSEKLKQNRDVISFIQKNRIAPGDVKAPNYLIYYMYVQWARPRACRVWGKSEFFRTFKQFFKRQRSGNQRFYKVNEYFNVDDDTYKKARIYDERKQKKNRRKSSKYPALDGNLNLPIRRDYIETDYVNGVYDQNGKQLIRPLTDNERKFYNKFYEEVIVANFTHDPILKKLLNDKKKLLEDSTILELKEEIKLNKNNAKRASELRSIIKELKQSNYEKHESKMKVLEKKIKDRQKEVLLYSNKEDQLTIYQENNQRNTCLFNQLKTGNNLNPLNVDEFDRYVSTIISDGEDALIDNIERDAVEKEEERQESILKLEKQLNRLKKNSNNGT